MAAVLVLVMLTGTALIGCNEDRDSGQNAGNPSAPANAGSGY